MGDLPGRSFLSLPPGLLSGVEAGLEASTTQAYCLVRVRPGVGLDLGPERLVLHCWRVHPGEAKPVPCWSTRGRGFTAGECPKKLGTSFCQLDVAGNLVAQLKRFLCCLKLLHNLKSTDCRSSQLNGSHCCIECC